MSAAFVVWEVEYPDEGSFEVEADSAEEAMARYRADTGEPEAELGAAPLTPELRAERDANERRGDA